MRIWMVILPMIIGCTNHSYYELKDVQNVLLDPPGSTPRLLRYQLPAESLYFSPGVKVERSDAGLVMRIVRCKVGKTCPVDIKSSFKDGISEVQLPEGENAPISLKDKNEKLVVADTNPSPDK